MTPTATFRALLVVLLWGVLAKGVASQSLGETYLVVISGLSGEPAYRERFQDWSSALVEAATTRGGVPADNVWYLGEDPQQDPARIRAKSTKEEIEKAFDEIGARARPGDRVFVVLVGHGSYGSGESRFNLPGPDITAAEFSFMLDRFGEQQIVFVNTASASGGFIEAISGKNRIVVTATKSGMQNNETRFAEFFVDAFAQDGADVDKDKRISVLEAFEYARLQVAHVYEEGNQLQTEHALLDDNGDQQGAQLPAESAESAEGNPGDGTVARLVFLEGSANRSTSAGAGDEIEDPAVLALYEQKRGLEERIEALKQQKDGMTEELYLQELESLLLELALKNREIAAAAGTPQ
ncbi:MAG: C13 family peptidase [Vicinamibacteria bacterium]